MTFQNFNSLASKMTKKEPDLIKPDVNPEVGVGNKVIKISVEQGQFTICLKF